MPNAEKQNDQAGRSELFDSSLPLTIGVVSAGACGGALAYATGLSSVVLKSPFSGNGSYIQLPLHAALGAFAAMIFVFLIANTDRSDRIRMLVLAGIAGFVWDAVIQSGKAFVTDRQQQSAIVENLTAQAGSLLSPTVVQDPVAFQTSFSDFIKKYSDARASISRPDLLLDLNREGAITGVWQKAAKQPWFDGQLKGWRQMYPNIDFDSLAGLAGE